MIDDVPVGVGAIYRDGEGSDVGELIQMWVAPEARGGSVARELLNALFGWAAGNGLWRVKAEVMIDNDRALRFYEGYGFRASEDFDLASHSEVSVMLSKPVG